MGGQKCAAGGQACRWGLGHATHEGCIGFIDEVGSWVNWRTGLGTGWLGRWLGEGWWEGGQMGGQHGPWENRSGCVGEWAEDGAVGMGK